MPPADVWKSVLQHYPPGVRPLDAEFLAGAGGFSGARFWRLKSSSGDHCLRRWPKEHPSRERLQFIHEVLRHVARQGVKFVPVPLVTIQGESFLKFQGHLWEISPWMPGQANYFAAPSQLKLRAAMGGLARFHQATESFTMQQGQSPGLAARIVQTRKFASQIEELAGQLADSANRPKMTPLAVDVLNAFKMLHPQILRALERAASLKCPLQPVIRDIWSDHVLFTDNAVSGIVDFGSLNVDSRSTDIARLLGSLVADDAQGWETGLSAYQSARRLSEEELHLVQVFDRSTVLLSGMYWLQWIYLEHRQFEDEQAIFQRLRVTLGRMRHLMKEML